MQDVSSSIEADIHRLEIGIRQLKMQYDMFFAGSLPREPFELRSELESLIRRNSNATIGKYAHRFHFNTLVSRFNTLSELWCKTLRAREEGERNGAGSKEREQEIEPLSIFTRSSSAWSAVDLPAPFSPNRPVREPGETEKETDSSTRAHRRPLR